MSMNLRPEWECNVCGTHVYGRGLPYGWLLIRTDKHVCRACREQVLKAGPIPDEAEEEEAEDEAVAEEAEDQRGVPAKASSKTVSDFRARLAARIKAHERKVSAKLNEDKTKVLLEVKHGNPELDKYFELSMQETYDLSVQLQLLYGRMVASQMTMVVRSRE